MCLLVDSKNKLNSCLRNIEILINTSDEGNNDEANNELILDINLKVNKLEELISNVLYKKFDPCKNMLLVKSSELDSYSKIEF